MEGEFGHGLGQSQHCNIIQAVEVIGRISFAGGNSIHKTHTLLQIR